MADLPPVEKHSYTPSISFDGGELDCGNGLLLLIRKHIDPLDQGQLLEVMSLESSVEADLPAWCRLTRNELVSWCKHGNQRSFLICKGKFDVNGRQEAGAERIESSPMLASSTTSSISSTSSATTSPTSISTSPSTTSTQPPSTFFAPPLPPLPLMGIGSWPRPRWLLKSLHEWLQGRIDDTEFQSTADDAVRLAVDGQLRAGVDVVTDGEQRRNNYASFVGRILDNCQLIPLTDLLSLVDDPEKFESELKSLDVPTDKVRHPVVFGKLSRTKPIAVAEARFLRSLTDKPIKVALPGPYLLTRTMWLDCITDRAYQSREELGKDIVRVLREEIHDLLAEGVYLIQLDEPVLTEVVFGAPKNKRSFMCGALSERGATDGELEFASTLVNEVAQGFPPERLALHICRGNWSPDESVALSGGYRPLMPLLQRLKIGTLFLEFCTSRAGDIEVISQLPPDMRLGIGVINQKNPHVETLEEVLFKAQAALEIVGAERLLLTPDCGFATFADNPLASADIATAKLKTLAAAAAHLRQRN